jgi:hypothetical protein
MKNASLKRSAIIGFASGYYVVGFSIGLLVLTPSLVVQAEWIVLQNRDSRNVEIAIDFRIEDIQIDHNGETTFAALATHGGEEIGFKVAITETHPSVMGVFGSDKEIMVTRCGVKIQSIGEPTANLERLLAEQLYTSSESEANVT